MASSPDKPFNDLPLLPPKMEVETRETLKLDLPVLYLSKYIIEKKSDYYRLLRGVTEHQKWEPWVLYMLDAVEQTSLYTRDKILAIRELKMKTIDFAKKKSPIPGLFQGSHRADFSPAIYQRAIFGRCRDC